MLSLSDKGGGCSTEDAREELYSSALPLCVCFPFVPREIAMGLELDEGLDEVEEEPDSRWRVCPFTVPAGADGLPAGALLDMGRTFGTRSGGSSALGV